MTFAGRPNKPIDWDLLDSLLEAGCSGVEIAPHFNMHPDTLYRNVFQKYSINFTDYAAFMFEKGNSALRNAQHLKAMSGDNTMMVWMGKQRLKQRESPTEITVSKEDMQTFTDVMDQLGRLQKEHKQVESGIE